MPVRVDSSGPGSLSPDERGQEFAFGAQHSRSNSVQSTATSTDQDPAGGVDRDARFPDLVRRDMEFFLARLTRTTSNESTGSSESA